MDAFPANFPQFLCLALAFAVALIAAGTYWRRHRLSLNAPSDAPVGRIIYRDAPTVRVVDSQRVDRLHKVAQLAAGEHIDVTETPADQLRRFRITLVGFERDNDADVARIRVEFGGTQVSCGPLVREHGYNEFTLPRTVRDETRTCVFHYREHADALEFMRIKVRGIDPAKNLAEIDVMQVSGHWPVE